MRLCRFDTGRLGVVEGDTLKDVTAALDVLPVYRYPLPACDPLILNLPAVTDRIRTLLAVSADAVPLSGATLLSPVANPGKVVAAPVNYQKHLDEVRGDEGLHHQNPINTIHKAGLFLKATSALAGPGEGIALRKLDRRNDHEIELAFVIGKTARNVVEGRRPRIRRRLLHRARHHDSRSRGAELPEVGRHLRHPRARGW